MIFLTEFFLPNSSEYCVLEFLWRSVDRKHLMRFQRETSVLKLLPWGLNRVLSLSDFLSTVFSMLADYFFEVLDITFLLFLNCTLYFMKTRCCLDTYFCSSS